MLQSAFRNPHSTIRNLARPTHLASRFVRAYSTRLGVVLGYLPAMTDPIVDTEQPHPDEAQIPTEPAPPIGSRFLFVDVAALRAKQLRKGARARLGEDAPAMPHKAERVAMEEVRRGLVYYDIPLPKSSRPEGEA